MLDGLAHEDPVIRARFAKVKGRNKLSARIVERGLIDPVNDIRSAFSDRTDFTPIAFQVERGLTDPYSAVRSAFARRSDISLSLQQIERGLTDPSDDVRTAMSKRSEFTPTPEQIERGLMDPCVSVRYNFNDRTDCEMTSEQLDRASKDTAAGVWTRIHHRRSRTSELNEPKVVSRIVDARMKNGLPTRSDGESILKKLSPKFSEELKAANSRLLQYLTPRSVLFALRLAAENSSCVLLQPGHSNYAWSDRTIPVVFIANFDGKLRFRVKRFRSYRNSQVTPAIWPALKGFPQGETSSKIADWSKESDGDVLSIATAITLPKGDLTCVVNEWRIN